MDIFLGIISIVAILLSPIIALQVAKFLERKKEKKERRLFLFKTLMMTRASRLNFDHIRALNMIDVEFYGNDKKSKDVVEAWKVYLDHLGNQTFREDNLSGWLDKSDELFVDLMQKMATCLDYDFDKSSIKKTSYYPEGHATIDIEFSQIRGELAKIVRGEKALPIYIINPLAPPENLP